MISSDLNIQREDGVFLLPKGLLDFPGEQENRPPIMSGRHVDYGATSDPSQYHKFIQNFKGTLEQLTEYFVNTPESNKDGKKLRSPHFYAAFIRHGKKGGAFFTICETAFQEAIALKKYNSVIFNSFMTSAKLTGNFEKVVEGLEIAQKYKSCDTETFNIFMKAAGTDRMEQVIEAYNSAVDAGLADIVTANTIIDLAGRQKMFDLARKVYEKWQDRADSYTYSSAIHLFGKMNRYDLSKAVYEEVKEKARSGKVKLNEYIVGNYMSAANSAGFYAEAIAAYKAAPKEIRNAFVNALYEIAVTKSRK